MSNWLFVVAAFAATWVTLLGYVGHLRRAVHRAQQMADSTRMRR
jgi:CcmD family protein